MPKLVLLALALGSLHCSAEPPDEVAPEPASRPAPPPSWVWADAAIEWARWGADSFRRARKRDCPVLIYFAAPGCEGTFSDAASAQWLLRDRFVAVRVDPFRRPDIARRYPAGGWPGLAVLLPDGRAFALAVDVPPDNVESFLWRIAADYEKQREVMERKLARSGQEPSRRPGPEFGATHVFAAAAAAFDTLHGGFGRGAKFPEIPVLRFLLAYHVERGDEAAWHLARRTVDAILNSPMCDRGEGGLFAFSYTPDWTTPVGEKDALDQAGMILVLLEAAARGGPRYLAAAADIVTYVADHLYDPTRGVFRGRQVRAEPQSGPWWTDPVVYADRNAALISASVRAAADLQSASARRMALAAGHYLVKHCIAPGGAVAHTCGADERPATGLLEDQFLVSAALQQLFELSGEPVFRDASRATRRFIETCCYDPDRQAFFDRPVAVDLAGAAGRRVYPYRDGMLPPGNVAAAELYLRLGERARAGVLLRGRRFEGAPGRAGASYGRVMLSYRKSRRTEEQERGASL